jgi:molybdate transport system substrate-binding protein
LEIDKDCLPKSIFVGQGERTGAVVARGDADIAFQQLSELKPVPGIAHITPLPLDLQPTVMVAAGVPGWSSNVEISRSIVRFLVSEKALTAIEESGLEPLWRCFDEDALTSFNFI